MTATTRSLSSRAARNERRGVSKRRDCCTQATSRPVSRDHSRGFDTQPTRPSRAATQPTSGALMTATTRSLSSRAARNERRGVSKRRDCCTQTRSRPGSRDHSRGFDTQPTRPSRAATQPTSGALMTATTRSLSSRAARNERRGVSKRRDCCTQTRSRPGSRDHSRGFDTQPTRPSRAATQPTSGALMTATTRSLSSRAARNERRGVSKRRECCTQTTTRSRHRDHSRGFDTQPTCGRAGQRVGAAT